MRLAVREPVLAFRFLFIAALLAASAGFIYGAGNAWAVATVIPPTPFAGRVSMVVMGASGKPDALVLQDHTLLEFPSASLANPNEIRVGDQLTGTGIQVLSAPNRVFDRVALSKGGRVIFDNSKMEYAPAPPLPSDTAATINQMRLMTQTSPLVAVGSTADGQIDRLVLAFGTNGVVPINVQVPGGAYVNPRSVYLGQPVAIEGAGVRFPDGGYFLHALTAQTVGGPWLFQARGYDHEQWMLKEGFIRQAMVTPRGRVNGVLLTDNTAIFFAPMPGGQVPQLLPGVRIRAAGPGVANRMYTDSMILSSEDRFVSLAPAITGPGLLTQMAGQIPPPLMIPMKDRSRVQAIFRNDAGAIKTIVLADRTTISIPPRLAPFLPRNLAVGRQIAVSGRGGTYMMGVGILADRLSVLRST